MAMDKVAALLVLGCLAVGSVHAVDQPGDVGIPRACRGAERMSDHVLLQHPQTASIQQQQQPPPPLPIDLGTDTADFCHTSKAGEQCYDVVRWVLHRDLEEHPSRYLGLDSHSAFEEVQAFLHERGMANCSTPCGQTTVAHRDVSQLDPVPAEQDPFPCTHAVEFDFLNAKVDINPNYPLWQQPLPTRYRHLGTFQGKAFDLIVNSTSPLKDVTGGVGNGGSRFGSTVVRPGTAAEVSFQLVDSNTSMPVLLPSFHFSFFDLDGSLSHGTKPGAESIHVSGFANYSIVEASEVQVHTDLHGRTVFKATQVGYGCDNPVDPLQLGYINCPWPVGHAVDQRKRTVTLLFQNTSGFQARLAAEAGGGWRSFLFAGSSDLVRTCQPTPVPAPVPHPNDGQPKVLGLCAVFGDPHFITFDGGHTVLFGDRVIWLVKSHDIWVQGWSRASEGKLTAIALGGPFLLGHNLVLHKGSSKFMQVLYDGRPVLHTPGSFRVPDLLHGLLSEEWQTDLHDGAILNLRPELKFDIGPWPERFLGRPNGGLVLLKLPKNVELTATGVNYMSAVVTMGKQEGGQSGFCGNFDGVAENDAAPVGPSFNLPLGDDLGGVPQAQNLFRLAGVEQVVRESITHAETHVLREQADPLQALEDCPRAVKATAEDRCAHVPDARLRHDCVLDMCLTGDTGVAEDMVAADILEEKVNTRGIPAYLGNGQCLDSEGQLYSGCIAGPETQASCMELLGELASVEGIVGAQLHPGGRCEILVQARSVDSHLKSFCGSQLFTGGVRLGQGQGLITSTTGSEGWRCWHLA